MSALLNVFIENKYFFSFYLIMKNIRDIQNKSFILRSAFTRPVRSPLTMQVAFSVHTQFASRLFAVRSPFAHLSRGKVECFRDCNDGAQFVSMGNPRDSWKIWSPKATWILSINNSSIFNTNFRVLLMRIRVVFSKDIFWRLSTRYEYFRIPFL